MIYCVDNDGKGDDNDNDEKGDDNDNDERGDDNEAKNLGRIWNFTACWGRRHDWQMMRLIIIMIWSTNNDDDDIEDYDGDDNALCNQHWLFNSWAMRHWEDKWKRDCVTDSMSDFFHE